MEGSELREGWKGYPVNIYMTERDRRKRGKDFRALRIIKGGRREQQKTLRWGKKE